MTVTPSTTTVSSCYAALPPCCSVGDPQGVQSTRSANKRVPSTSTKSPRRLAATNTAGSQATSTSIPVRTQACVLTGMDVEVACDPAVLVAAKRRGDFVLVDGTRLFADLVDCTPCGSPTEQHGGRAA